MTSVDPKTVDCRTLRFSTLDDVSHELDRLESADAAGKVRCAGNWTAGQCFGHLAAWINYGYEGFPMKPPPWIIRFLIRRQLRKYLTNGMPRGARIPGSPDGTWATEKLSTPEGAGRLRRALARLAKREPARFHSPGFGPLSDDERIALTLRHCELHMGYLHPE